MMNCSHRRGADRVSHRTSTRAVIVALMATLAFAACAGAADARTHGRHVTASHFNARTSARLRTALQKAWATTWAPGVIVGVWVGHRGWTAVRGSTRRASGPLPIRADHTRVGSVTKTMLGTLILELVDQHKLSLNETIQRWFPKLPDARKITIEQLGNMSSGIATYTGNAKLTDRYFAHPTAWWNPDTLIAGGASLPREFDPGKGFDYSDTNFVMLGRIAEKVTGKPLSELLRTMVFTPLGMSQTSYPTSNRIPRPFWNGYTVQGSTLGNALDSTSWTPSFAAGAGAAISTLGNLHRWARAVGTGALLTPAAQRARLIPNRYSEGGGRAYLFAMTDSNGWLGHEGSTPGYNTELQYLPSLKATIVVAVNTDIGDQNNVSPALKIFSALAAVVAPHNIP